MKKGDVGTVIDLNVGSDISSATVRKIIYQKPSGTVEEWAATLYGTTHIRYTTVADDIDEVGMWRFQAYIETPSGKWYGDIATHPVGEKFVLSA